MAASSTQRERGLSDSMGVAALVLMTVLGTLSVGMTVFLATGEDEGQFGAEFNFQAQENLELLIIFYDSGDDLRAGSLYVDGPANNVSWAELTGVDEDATVSPGTGPVRVGKNTPYGSSVSPESYFEIIYHSEDGERLVLGTFGEPAEGEGPDTGGDVPGGDEPGGGPGDDEPGGGPGDDEPGGQP
jgi:hypothetical protein